jgi:hypothetical protein
VHRFAWNFSFDISCPVRTLDQRKTAMDQEEASQPSQPTDQAQTGATQQSASSFGEANSMSLGIDRASSQGPESHTQPSPRGRRLHGNSSVLRSRSDILSTQLSVGSPQSPAALRRGNL